MRKVQRDCLFQNTLRDLSACYSNWDADALSDEEEMARRQLLLLCENIVSSWSYTFDLVEVDEY